MIDWDKLMFSVNGYPILKGFAEGDVSGRLFYASHSGTASGGEARNLLRKHGVTYARRLARKALRRRGVEINVAE